MDNRPLSGLSHTEALQYWELFFNISTTRPEEMEIIAPAIIKPPKDRTPIVVTEINVRPTWIDQSYIQCNACGNKSKFKNNGHIVNYEDGYFYVIGPDCGSDEHIQKIRIAVNKYEETQKLRFADKNIQDFATQYTIFHEEVLKIKNNLDAVINIRQAMSRRAPAILDLLKSSNFQNDPRLLFDNQNGTQSVGFIKCPEIFSSNYYLFRKWISITCYLEKHFDLDIKKASWDANFTEQSAPELSKKISELKQLIREATKADLKLQNNLQHDFRILNEVTGVTLFSIKESSLRISYRDEHDRKTLHEFVEGIPSKWLSPIK